GLDPRALPQGPLADLPALELENPLYRVLVHAKQRSHRAVTKRGLGLDHRLDRCGQLGVDLCRCLGRLVVRRTPRHLKPAAELGHGDYETFVLQALLDRAHQLSSFPSREANFFRARISSIASP